MSKNNENKVSIFNIILAILKVICIIALILIILVLAMQRFSNNEIAIGGYRIFNVATGSMIPDYEIGDVLVVKEVNTDTLKIDDDVTYLGKTGTFAGRVVTHRIVNIEESENGKIFTTRGTANDADDPSITGDQIYGKVIYKCVVVSMLSKLANNLTAFYVIVFIPLGILIFLQIKDNIDLKKQNKIEDEENNDDTEEENQ